MKIDRTTVLAALCVALSTGVATAQESEPVEKTLEEAGSPKTNSEAAPTKEAEPEEPEEAGAESSQRVLVDLGGVELPVVAPDPQSDLGALFERHPDMLEKLVEEGVAKVGDKTFDIRAADPAPSAPLDPIESPVLFTIYENGHVEVADKDDSNPGRTFRFRALPGAPTANLSAAIWPVRQSDSGVYRLENATTFGSIGSGTSYPYTTDSDSDSSTGRGPVVGWRVSILRSPTPYENGELLLATKSPIALECIPWSTSQLVTVATLIIPNAEPGQFLDEVVYGNLFEVTRSGLEDDQRYYLPVTKIPPKNDALRSRIETSKTSEGLFGGGYQGLMQLLLTTGLRASADSLKGATVPEDGLSCSASFKAKYTKAAANFFATNPRTEFVQTDVLETGEKQTLKLCHTIGCHEPKKIVGEVTVIPKKRSWQPTAMVGLSYGGHVGSNDEDAPPTTGYRYEQITATGGPEDVYQLRDERVPLQDVMLSLSLGTTLRFFDSDWANKAFVGITPLSFSGITFRVLPQFGLTAKWKIWGHAYFGLDLMVRKTERLNGDIDAMRLAVVPAGAKPPTILTTRRWEPFLYGGFAFDLAPVTDEVFQTINSAFGGSK